jgi:hypothetical protein
METEETMRRYVRLSVVLTEKQKIVANDDYTEACDRCGAEIGKPCTLQTVSFRQWSTVSTNTCEYVPIGTVALRIHWERRQTVLKTRKRNVAVEQTLLKKRQETTQ